MTRLALLADLHFGSVPQGLEELLLDDLVAMNPDAVLIAGDLTMRASMAEFAAARAWLDRLPLTRLVVPGNHDIPAYNLIQRFLQPFSRFERTVPEAERRPLAFADCHVVGLNTVASWQPHLRWQEGRVRKRDVARFAQAIEATPPGRFRVVVAHHPFAKVPEMERARPVRRATSMLDAFDDTSVDLVLSGHTHQSFVLPVAGLRNRLIALGAPTALSSRRRGEENGYWLIDIAPEEVRLARRLREGGKFVAEPERVYAASDFEAPSPLNG
jgi:3',5'-cyclic AMP phosphodiesterase CpdA